MHLFGDYMKKQDNKESQKNPKEICNNLRKNIEQKDKLIEQLKRENLELVDNLKRLQAEFDNYKKRINKQSNEVEYFVLKDFITELLPILDSFEVALKNNKNDEEFRKGVELIFAKLHNYLEKLGVKEIEAKGSFNPNFHEALLVEKSNRPDGTILEELQKGYTLNNRVIRTAKVKISKQEIENNKSK